MALKTNILVIAAIMCGLSVILGAFGAHALKKTLNSEMLDAFQTGVKYQMFHGLALFLIGILQIVKPELPLAASAYCFIIGSILFSGSIYLLTTKLISGIGLLTPIGGLFLISGWALLTYRLVTHS